MPDDHQQPRDGARPGDRPELEETGQFSPFADEPDPVDRPRSGEARPEPIDRTARMPAVPGGRDADATRIVPPTGDATRVVPPGGDATRIVPPGGDATRVTARAGRPDATSIMPPMDLPTAGRTEAAARAAAGGADPDDVWTARAQVRAPRPGQGGDYTPTDWVPVPAEPQRPWWMPIGVGVLVLVLLALLGVGIWLITRAAGDDDPATPATVPATPATTAPVAEPTTERPETTEPTTTEPTRQEPADVEIPALVGQSSADARRALDRVGLAYRLVSRASSTAPPGTVISSDPEEGSDVPPDTEVTLVIARAAAPSPSTNSPTPGGSEEPPDED